MDRNSGLANILAVAAVALRKESVDRNCFGFSAFPESNQVALRKESVDRNLYYGDDLTFSDGRSPQGERG